MSHKCHIPSSATCFFLPSGVSPPTPLRNLALKRWRIILVIFPIFFSFFFCHDECVCCRVAARSDCRIQKKRLRHLLSMRSNNSLAACGFLHEKGILRALIRSLENWTTLKQPSDSSRCTWSSRLLAAVIFSLMPARKKTNQYHTHGSHATLNIRAETITTEFQMVVVHFTV